MTLHEASRDQVSNPDPHSTPHNKKLKVDEQFHSLTIAVGGVIENAVGPLGFVSEFRVFNIFKGYSNEDLFFKFELRRSG